jgi:hypothetical protein
MAATLVDLVEVTVATGGSGALVLGSASSGFRGVEALANGSVYNYFYQSGAVFEFGQGTYLSAGQQLTRSPQYSSNGGSAVSIAAGSALGIGMASVAEISAAVISADVINAANQALAAAQLASTAAENAANAAATASALVPAVVLQATEPIAAGAAVNVYAVGSASRVRTADGTDPTKPANGFASSSIGSGSSGQIAFAGMNSIPSISISGPVWLSDTTPGGYTLTPPSTTGHISQQIGVAVPSIGILFNAQPAVTL